MSKTNATVPQQEFPFMRRGSKRVGAGRKRRLEWAGVSHKGRPKLRRDQPVHVTMHLIDGLPNLRNERAMLLGVELPKITLPVASGRNVATLVEVAVRLQLLAKQGYDAASLAVAALEDRLRPAPKDEG